ncbi:MAG: hypothetical protein KGZ63_15205 [Clostridiales bacterium]|jgi:hypothetical protein|nr:hypothetical protein [Clostridiales bacterium]
MSYIKHFDFVPGKWFPELSGVPGKGWRLIEASPLPPKDEIVAVAHAIMHRTRYAIWGGQLRSSNYWGTKFQYLSNQLVEAVYSIENTRFLVALFSGTHGVLNGQPTAIVLEPLINHATYPDHPHLNLAHTCKINGKEFFLPTSLCYTNNPVGLGKSEVERVNNAAEIVCEWLFRHQIWLSTRQHDSTGIWLGPEEPPEAYSYWLYNPHGRCRCGDSQAYKNCHMVQDVSELWKQSKEWASDFVQAYTAKQYWHQGHAQKELESIKLLKKKMI